MTRTNLYLQTGIYSGHPLPVQSTATVQSLDALIPAKVGLFDHAKVIGRSVTKQAILLNSLQSLSLFVSTAKRSHP